MSIIGLPRLRQRVWLTAIWLVFSGAAHAQISTRRPDEMIHDKPWSQPEAAGALDEFGVTGDESPIDSLRFQQAINSGKQIVFSNKTYTFSGCFTVPRFTIFRGFGPSGEDVGDRSSVKVVLTGNCKMGYFSNTNPAAMQSHSGFFGINFVGNGDTRWLFDFSDTIEDQWNDVTFYTKRLNSCFLRSRKVASSSNSWNNRIVNVRVQVPDSSHCHLVEEDWSDSEIVNSHFTGGLGYYSSGYGAKYIGNQFERSSRSGLVITKMTRTRDAVIVANHFDANAISGLEIDVSLDTSDQRVLHLTIAGNTYRTQSPRNGAKGTADILLTNMGGQTYSLDAPTPGESHQISDVPAIAYDNSRFHLETHIYGDVAPFRLKSFKSIDLPICNATLTLDTVAAVSDAAFPTSGKALIGGGTTRTLVYCDGSHWNTQ